MSDCELKPLVRDWKPVVAGKTFPAQNFTETLADAALSRVRVRIWDSDGTLKLTLDSDATGVTINTSTAGAWDYDIDAISAATTGGLTPGFHEYEQEITDTNGVVTADFTGQWQILQSY